MQLSSKLRSMGVPLMIVAGISGCLPLRTGPLVDADVSSSADVVADTADDLGIDAPREDSSNDVPPPIDAITDATLDVQPDARTDAQLDVIDDAQPDAGTDASIDVPVDARIDAPMDVLVDRPIPVDMPPADVTIPACTLPLQPAIGAASETVMGTLSGTSNMRFSGCDLDMAGPEHVYPFTLSQRSSVDIRATNLGPGVDPTLYIRRQCTDEASEIACSRSRALRTTLDPGAYFLFVDQHATMPTTIGGDYTLQFNSAPIASNASCAAALPLASDVSVTGRATAAEQGLICLASDQYPLYWRATIPAGRRLRATLQPAIGDLGTVGVRESCASSSCVATPRESRSAGAPTDITVDALPGGGARDVILATSSSGPGTYTLRYSLETPSPGTSWLSAYPLVLNGPELSFPAMPGSYPLSCLGPLETYVLYTLEVPARTAVRLSATWGGAWRVGVQAAADSSTCVADSLVRIGGPFTIGPFNNMDTAPRTFYVIVGGDGVAIRAVGTPL